MLLPHLGTKALGVEMENEDIDLVNQAVNIIKGTKEIPEDKNIRFKIAGAVERILNKQILVELKSNG